MRNDDKIADTPRGTFTRDELAVLEQVDGRQSRARRRPQAAHGIVRRVEDVLPPAPRPPDPPPRVPDRGALTVVLPAAWRASRRSIRTRRPRPTSTARRRGRREDAFAQTAVQPAADAGGRGRSDRCSPGSSCCRRTTGRWAGAGAANRTLLLGTLASAAFFAGCCSSCPTGSQRRRSTSPRPADVLQARRRDAGRRAPCGRRHRRRAGRCSASPVGRGMVLGIMLLVAAVVRARRASSLQARSALRQEPMLRVARAASRRCGRRTCPAGFGRGVGALQLVAHAAHRLQPIAEARRAWRAGSARACRRCGRGRRGGSPRRATAAPAA